MEATSSRKLWTGTIVVTLVVTILFLFPYLSVTILTALMAFIFYPLFKRLKRKKGVFAAVTTLLVSYLVVLIPIAFVAIATVSQLASFAETASQSRYWENMPDFAQKTIDFTNDVLAPITGQRPSFTDQNVIDFLKTAIPTIARTMANVLVNALSSLPGLSIGILLYTFLFVEFLLYGPHLVTKVEALSPFGSDITKHYIEKIGLMASAMVKGQLIISMVISAFSAALLIPLGFGHFYFILFVLFTVLNFIPLGAGIIFIPMAVYTMFTGQFWLSLVMIGLYYAFGSTVEPLMRTRLMSPKIQLSVGLTILATFCGIAYFGMLGVVYGPIIMILITTTLDFYIDAKSKKQIAPKEA